METGQLELVCGAGDAARNGIRITGVRIHKLSAPLRERFGWSLNWTSHRTATLVEVRTDCGITGWGDGAAGEDVLLAEPKGLVVGGVEFTRCPWVPKGKTVGLDSKWTPGRSLGGG